MKRKLIILLIGAFMMTFTQSCKQEAAPVANDQNNDQPSTSNPPPQNPSDPIVVDPDPDPEPDPEPTPGEDEVTLGVDNSHFEGDWSDSDIPGFEDSPTKISEDETAQVDFVTTSLKGGPHCLSAYVPIIENATEGALFKVFEEEKDLGEVTLNQKVSEAAWVHLGVFKLRANKKITVSLQRDMSHDGEILISNTFRFKKLLAGHDCHGKKVADVDKEKIIDFGDNGYREKHGWKTSTLIGQNESTVRESRSREAWVRYTALVKKNKYCLSLSKIIAEDGVRQAKVSVKIGEQVDRTFINLQDPPLGVFWHQLGEFTFNSDKKAVVTIRKADPEDDGYLRADALKFEHGPCR